MSAHTQVAEPSSRTDAPPRPDTLDLPRLGAWLGVLYAVCQVGVAVVMGVVVLPHGGLPTDPPLTRGRGVLDAAELYRAGNYALVLSCMLLLGFLGTVGSRLRRADGSGVLATVAVAAGSLVALVWAMAAMLHDVALDTAAGGTDLRILAGWDSVAPYSLALSAIPRVFLIGALVLGLRRGGAPVWLTRAGVALAALTLVGSATLVNGLLFPLLALSTLGFDLWIGAVAWRWARER